METLKDLNLMQRMIEMNVLIGAMQGTPSISREVKSVLELNRRMLEMFHDIMFLFVDVEKLLESKRESLFESHDIANEIKTRCFQVLEEQNLYEKMCDRSIIDAWDRMQPSRNKGTQTQEGS
ncbi:MAG TPA: hypothetical protein VKX17_26295 [Planctomycetota bacterium]|nr:hypothetical protein [Planctomycetota bacterium]